VGHFGIRTSGESPPDPLRSTLEQLRLEGAIFFRSELSHGFAFESAPLTLADLLKPGADRLILFHIVAGGSCWVAVDDGVRHWAHEGDVIVLPYADHYTMGGAEPADTVSILELLDPPPWDDIPVIRHGGGGDRTDVVCGLGRSPIRYLTEWRMHLAESLLTTDLTVYDVARRVGYVSEEAFSRAFKRERGRSPAHWRASRTAG
jgi:hypothetical protein